MLRLVVALEAEARPLIEHYRLQRDPRPQAFKTFRRDEISLVVSGSGKAAAAAAVAVLHLGGGGERDAAWINVGIAGHGRLPVGEAVVAHKIRDRAAGRAWYPPQLTTAPCPGDVVVTVDRPETAFAEPGAYDMEASAFYATACRFATAELVQCLKIVSDGPGADLKKITAPGVTRLVESQMAAVDRLAESCRSRSHEVRRRRSDPPDFDRCLADWRFTVSEKRQLRRLLERRRALAAGLPLPTEDLPRQARGGDVNRRLRRWLDGLPVRLRQ